MGVNYFKILWEFYNRCRGVERAYVNLIRMCARNVGMMHCNLKKKKKNQQKLIRKDVV